METYDKMLKIYRKGRVAEYKVCNLLKEKGYDIVQRTAGSHSPFDIIAIHKENKDIILVQVKSGTFTTNEKNKLYIENRGLQGKFNVRYKIWKIG